MAQPITSQPRRLLSYAVLATVAFGTAHLAVDLVAFGGGFFGALAGALTDLKTIVTGFALLVGFVAVVGGEPDPAAASWIDRYRTQPAANFPPLVYAMLYVHLLQMIFAQLTQRSADSAFLLSLAAHDVLFLATSTAVITTLATVAVHRAGSWDRDAEARQLVLLGLYGTVGGGALYALFQFFDLVGDDGMFAVALTAYAVLQLLFASAIVVACLMVVSSLTSGTPDASDRFQPETLARRALDAASPVPLGLLGSAGVAGVAFVLFRLAAAGDSGGAFIARAFFNSLFDVTLALGLLLVLKTMWPPEGHLFSGSRVDQPDASLLRTAVMAVAILGLLSAIVSFWALSEFGAGEAWYYLFNRLVRTAVAVGAVIGLWALRDTTTT